jgi:hypothetical protein
MNEAKKKTNKFFYCFKQYYNFQTGILKRGNSLLGADHISPNFLFNILHDRIFINSNFYVESQAFIEFCQQELKIFIKDC